MTGAPRTVPPSKLAIVAGSGMGGLADGMAGGTSTSFADIAGVGECTVPGHAGEIREGTIAGRSCILMLGRRHHYEGAAAAMSRLVAWLVDRGVTHLLVTSAAGALRGSLSPGEIVVAHDLIDRQNRGLRARDMSDSALMPSRTQVGIRDSGNRTSPDMSRAVDHARPAGRLPSALSLDPELVAKLERAATRAGVVWQRGTIVCGSGPAYETAAEVRSLQEAGDVATMSAAPEVAAANRIGLPVAALAVVTNPGTGIAKQALAHAEVLEAGRRSAGRVAELIRQLVVEL